MRPPIDPLKCRTKTGPGDYDPKFMNTTGNFTMKERLEPKGIDRNKQPGPGHYSDMRQIHYQKELIGSKIGCDERKSSFLKANGHSNPGPGSYKNLNFADKRAAPKFGFGSSAREKDYIGLSK